jgi:hypothetical protein
MLSTGAARMREAVVGSAVAIVESFIFMVGDGEMEVPVYLFPWTLKLGDPGYGGLFLFLVA